MPTVEQHRHNTFLVRANYTPNSSELFLDTDNRKLFVGDGSTGGGLQVEAPDIIISSATTFGADASDSGRLFVFTGAGCSFTLAQAGSVGSSEVPDRSGIQILNLGSADVVVTPTTSQINDDVDLTLAPGDNAVIWSNGTDYYALVGKIAGSGGSVTSVATGNGLTGGPITTTGTISPTLTIQNETTNYTVLSGDNFKKFNNAGAGGTVVLTLPAATAPFKVSGLVVASQILRFDAAGTDVIANAGVTSAAGGTIESDLANSTIDLECQVNGVWVVTAITGTWTTA